MLNPQNIKPQLFSVSALAVSAIFIALVFLSSFMWITALQAQPTAVESTPSPATQEPAVKTFTVAPVQRTTAILMPNAQTPAPPAPLDPETKSAILKSLGGSARLAAPAVNTVQASPVLEHLLLTAKQPFFSEQGFLTLTLAATVHPETAINFKSSYPASAGLKLKVEKGRTYLLDFAVKSAQSGTYLLETESGKQEFEDKSAGKQHILVALKATSSGWTTVRLNRGGTAYNLYYVEVTRVN